MAAGCCADRFRGGGYECRLDAKLWGEVEESRGGSTCEPQAPGARTLKHLKSLTF